MQYSKVRFLFLALAAIVCSGGGVRAQMVPNPDPVRGVVLRYNMPVTVGAQSFSAYRLWTYFQYDAQQLDNTGTMQTVASSQPPYDLSGILAGGSSDPRSYSGADMVALQKVGDSGNLGAVHYGDSVGMTTWCVAGARTGSEVVYPEGRFLITLPTCRNNWAQLGTFGLAFVRAEHPAAQGPNHIFTLQNVSNPSDNGVVYQNDLVYLVSNGDALHSGKRVWQSVGSEYGATWNEWLLGDSKDANLDVAQGQLFIKRYVINATNAVNAGTVAGSLIPNSAAAQALVSGTQITIKFNQTGHFLHVESNGTLTANGTNAGDPACQFTVTQVGQWIGLQSNATGNYVEAVSINDATRAPGVAPYTVRAVASTCDNTTPWTHWGIFPTTQGLRQLTLMSRSTLGCLNVQATGGTVLTSAGRNIPADILPTSLADVTIVIQNPPAGFALDAGLVFALSVGSRNGGLEVWGIDPTATLLQRYDPFNMSPNPWDTYSAMMMQNGVQVQIQPIYSVSCASDGTLAIADGKGVVYLYDWVNQIFLPFNMTTITGTNIRADKVVVGNANSIWVVNQLSQILYQFNMTTNFWEARTATGVATDVGVGLDGTVVSINVAGNAYRYLGQNQWQVLPGTKLNSITVGSASYIMGVYQGQLWNVVNNQFVPMLGSDGTPAVGFQTSSINAAGTCFVIDQSDDIWYKGTAGVTIPTTVTLPAVNTSTQLVPVVAVQVQQPTQPTRAAAQASGQIEAVVKVTPTAAAAPATTAAVTTASAVVTPTAAATAIPGATPSAAVVTAASTTTPAATTAPAAAVTSTAVTSTAAAKAQLQQTKAASVANKTATEAAVKAGKVTNRPKGQVVAKAAATAKTVTSVATTPAPAAPVTTVAPAAVKPVVTTPTVASTVVAKPAAPVTPVATTKAAAAPVAKAPSAAATTAKGAKAAGR